MKSDIFNMTAEESACVRI